MTASIQPSVLHYTGGDDDQGGIVSVVRNLAATGRFECVLGVNPGAVQRRQPALPVLELPRLAGETISPANFWQARTVAGAVQSWLAADPRRIFHGHTRAGLLAGLWLRWRGERRVVVSVHCYGRQRWFYRWAARQLGARLFWLSPAMKRYYGVGDDSWAQCVPGCVPGGAAAARPARPDGLIRLGGIGMLVRWKNWDLVLEALARLPETVRRRFCFRHIGATDGSPEAEAAAAAWCARGEAADLRGLVEWRGPQATTERFLAETDCLVVTSHNEPFSVAVLEALLAGVPVLAADTGGARDVVQPGRTGWFYASGEAGDLARQLARLAETDALAKASADPAALARFTAANVAAQWAEIYSRLAEG